MSIKLSKKCWLIRNTFPCYRSHFFLFFSLFTAHNERGIQATIIIASPTNLSLTFWVACMSDHLAIVLWSKGYQWRIMLFLEGSGDQPGRARGFRTHSCPIQLPFVYLHSLNAQTTNGWESKKKKVVPHTTAWISCHTKQTTTNTRTIIFENCSRGLPVPTSSPFPSFLTHCTRPFGDHIIPSVYFFSLNILTSLFIPNRRVGTCGGQVDAWLAVLYDETGP